MADQISSSRRTSSSNSHKHHKSHRHESSRHDHGSSSHRSSRYQSKYSHDINSHNIRQSDSYDTSRSNRSSKYDDEEYARPSKRARRYVDENDDDDDLEKISRQTRKEKFDSEDEGSTREGSSSDEDGEWVVANEAPPAPTPHQSLRDSWMQGSNANISDGQSGEFDFGSLAGEHERQKKTILDRKPRSANDPYYVKSSTAAASPPASDPQLERVRPSASASASAESATMNQSQLRDTRKEAATVIDETKLNKMKAAYLKAKLRRAPNADQMEKEYNEAMAMVTGKKVAGVVDTGDRVEVLSLMDTRGVLNAPNKTEDEMTIADMVAEEKRTRGLALGSEGRLFADRIGRDKRFKDDLDYMDENADKLAQRVQRNQIDLKTMAIDEVRRMNSILDSCPLCQSENSPPIAPVVCTGTRVYLSLPTMPQLSPGAASIVPISHRKCTLECDDDEWEEIRNFMKSLSRMYYSQNRGVIFYENAASPGRRRHASIEAVPLPFELAETASAYFREAMLSSDEEWSSHKKVINTLERATKGGLGRRAFRQSLVKEVSYFHVWFTIDGGYGHVVEDSDRWPKGDLFAREVIGGMLDLEPDVIKRQSRWKREIDPRLKGFRQMWANFDWTKQLEEYPSTSY
ncbi:CwfJ C-terminus 1-domain-containing protein-like protein [Lipomyces starkeyi]